MIIHMLEGWERLYERPKRQFLADILEDIADDAFRYAAKDTGEMAGTLAWHAHSSSHGTVTVGSDHWYFQEYGARPHVIRAQSSKGALHWAGAQHPVKKVNHPGNSAQPFMRPALYKYRTV